MKKTFTLITALILLLCLSVPVFAASTTYQLDALDIQLDIPSDYIVITRDTSATDSIFGLLDNVTYQSVMQQFRDGNIYLNAITFERSEEIVVTMTEISLADFSTIGDTILNTLAAALPNQYASYGIEVIKHDLYQHTQTKFVRLYFYDTNNQVYGLQYYTVYGGKAMNFTMRSSEGSLLAVQEQNIKDIVDSIQFGIEPLPTVTEPVVTEPEISQTVPSEPEGNETIPAESLPAGSDPSATEAATVGPTAAAVNGVAGTQMTVNSQANSSDDSLMLWILIGVGVAAVVVIVLLIVLLRRKKKAPAPVPVAAAPGAPMPGAPIPGTQIPVSQIPVSQIPVEQIPVSQIPASQIPVEQIPVSQIPASQIPVEQQYRPDPVYPTAFCPNCGTALPEGAQFCTVCGCQLTNRQ